MNNAYSKSYNSKLVSSSKSTDNCWTTKQIKENYWKRFDRKLMKEIRI